MVFTELRHMPGCVFIPTHTQTKAHREQGLLTSGPGSSTVHFTKLQTKETKIQLNLTFNSNSPRVTRH